MIKIGYPFYQPKIESRAGKEFIFDEVRKRWIMLTPEEWVRQNFLRYLLQVMKYPASLVAIEKEIKVGDLVKRFDILVYDRMMVPWMVIECKEMNEVLNAKVLNQALRYNIKLQVPYIVITNGSYCYGFKTNKGNFVEIDELPGFQENNE